MNYYKKNIDVHITAIIGEANTFGENVSIGCYAIIGNNITIGENTKIGNGVIIYDGTVIGKNVRIDDNTVVGKLPMSVSASSLKRDNNLVGCSIGDNCVIGTAAILYKGSNIDNNCMIADIATIRESVSVGKNTIIGRGVAIENNCTIGSHCKLETNVYITAYSELEDYVFIAPGVVTSNDNYAARLKGKDYRFKGVTVKRGGRIGAQATILPGKIISEDAFAAAGSVVTKDISAKKINCGNPAKYLRDVPEDQLIDNQ